jgi:hypothetical protein
MYVTYKLPMPVVGQGAPGMKLEPLRPLHLTATY